MHSDRVQPIVSPLHIRARFAAAVIFVAFTFVTVSLINRLPILFPDTIGYSSAGEAVLSVFGGHVRRHRSQPVSVTAAEASLAPASTGVSEARSPYYGVTLALGDRIGGVWLSAVAQALVAATALLLAVRRLELTGAAGIATAVLAAIGGLAFYAGVIIPDVFLGPAILALAFLLTDRAMSRREQLFWAAVLLAAMLFHRGFLAVGLIVALGAAFGWRQWWLVRRGWRTVAVACAAAVIAHAAVAPVVRSLYGAKIASQPFVLARMIEGRVVPAYLADVCPTRSYLLCRLQARLPMDHDQFLWFPAPDGVFNAISLADRQRVSDEANAIVLGAVAARPVAAIAEAVDYSVREFFFAGMDDFAQHVPARWHIDPALAPAMEAYPGSGIVAGDFPLHGFSRVTQSLYSAALAILVASVVMLARPGWFGRRQIAAIDCRLLATLGFIMAGLVVNAVVSGTLSGIRDRYTGRVAWLASLAAAALLYHALSTTRRRAAGGEDAA